MSITKTTNFPQLLVGELGWEIVVLPLALFSIVCTVQDSVKLNLCRELLTMHEDLKEAQKAFEFDQEELAHMSEGEV